MKKKRRLSEQEAAILTTSLALWLGTFRKAPQWYPVAEVIVQEISVKLRRHARSSRVAKKDGGKI